MTDGDSSPRLACASRRHQLMDASARFVLRMSLDASRRQLRDQERDAGSEHLRNPWYAAGWNAMISRDPVVCGADGDPDQTSESSDGQSGAIEGLPDPGPQVRLASARLARGTIPTGDSHSAEYPLMADSKARGILSPSAIDVAEQAYQDGMPAPPRKEESLIVTEGWQKEVLAAMAARGLTYAAAADLVGCGHQTLHDMLQPEKLKSGGKSKWVRRISEAFGIELDVVVPAEKRELVKSVLSAEEDKHQMIGSLLALKDNLDIVRDVIAKAESTDPDTAAAIKTLLRGVKDKQ